LVSDPDALQYDGYEYENSRTNFGLCEVKSTIGRRRSMRFNTTS
jgi:hypothetical protein